MKNKNMELQKLKSFCNLSGVYFRRLQRGMSIGNLVSQLDNEIFVYQYYKDMGELNNMEYNGFIEKDDDIEENWYALTKAIYDFTQKEETGKKIIDDYILTMRNR